MSSLEILAGIAGIFLIALSVLAGYGPRFTAPCGREFWTRSRLDKHCDNCDACIWHTRKHFR